MKNYRLQLHFETNLKTELLREATMQGSQRNVNHAEGQKMPLWFQLYLLNTTDTKPNKSLC